MEKFRVGLKKTMFEAELNGKIDLRFILIKYFNRDTLYLKI